VIVRTGCDKTLVRISKHLEGLWIPLGSGSEVTPLRRVADVVNGVAVTVVSGAVWRLGV
jgi:hypothetical protein